MAKRHDFLDEQWDQGDETPEPRRPKAPRERSQRRLPAAGCVFAVVLVLVLAAVYIVLEHPRQAARPSVEVHEATAPPAEAASDGGGSSRSAEATTSTAASHPAADADMEKVITRWATRKSTQDQSWSDDLSAQIAPDASRRMAVLQCLPAKDAPLHVDSLTADAPPNQDGETWSASYTLTVTGKKHDKARVFLRASATWDDSSDAWMLTSLDCPPSGGDE